VKLGMIAEMTYEPAFYPSPGILCFCCDVCVTKSIGLIDLQFSGV
jgi:hypothetical protein